VIFKDKFSNNTSSHSVVKHGVPQGSTT